ncbi:PREDICTED: uncharacterized protein LOC109243208 [Nicotiana attenuata]|uniref:uncharacterized protein LOC109243208 n=1 Tax=Nicotiana attenuata TaxID=49451 RepID=UPI000905C93C|nr:PREDICTED: uncharacterized protein LOC109243208 [Nicotiana attenuata]
MAICADASPGFCGGTPASAGAIPGFCGGTPASAPFSPWSPMPLFSRAFAEKQGGIGSRAKDAGGYILWYSGVQKGKNGVGILVDRELGESVFEIRRVNNRLMIIKLVVGQCTLNVVSAYESHAGLDEEAKRRFWEGLDEIVHQILPAENLFIGGDFNGHIGSTVGGYGEVHGVFGFGERNGGGTSLLDFAKAYGLVIASSSFSKREEHLVNF